MRSRLLNAFALFFQMRQRGESMKKAIWFATLGLLLSMILVGCGEKTQEDIMTDLDNKLSEMTGYKAKSTMTLQNAKQF